VHSNRPAGCQTPSPTYHIQICKSNQTQLACHFIRLSLFQLHLWLLCGGGRLCIALGGCQSRSWQLGVQHVAVHDRGNHSNQAYSAWLHGPQLQEPRSQQCLHTTPRLSQLITHTRQERRALRCTESSHTKVVMMFPTLGRHKLQTMLTMQSYMPWLWGWAA